MAKDELFNAVLELVGDGPPQQRLERAADRLSRISDTDFPDHNWRKDYRRIKGGLAKAQSDAKEAAQLARRIVQLYHDVMSS